MNKNNIVIGFILTILVVLAGCSSNNSDAEQNAFFGIGQGSSGSTESGVRLSFAEGNPPSEMFQGQPYTFAFVFQNYQIHDIEDLVIRTKGYDRSFVSGLSEEYDVNRIPRASEQIGAGVYSGLIVEGVTVDGFEGNYNFNPEFDYCYTAQTSFREEVCVPSDRNQCTTEVSDSSAQNGPLSIQVLNINHVGDEVRVEFSVSNSRNGDIVNECFNTEDYANAYDVSSARLGTTEGNCAAVGTDEFLIGNGRGNFMCTFPRSSDDSYASQLFVELEYLYEQSLKVPLVVRDLN